MTEKQTQKIVDAAFYKVSSNRQIPIMKLGAISKAGMDAAKAGEDIEAAVLAAVNEYAIN